MADIQATLTSVGRGDGSTVVATWANVTSADTCHAVSLSEYADRSVHVYGTFDSATVTIQGSNNDGSSFATLADPTETTISISSERIRAILENTVLIRPSAAGGGGNQSLSIAILFHLTNPLRQ